MAIVFTFIFLASLGFFILGILSPKAIKPLVRSIWTRGRIAAVFGMAVVLSFAGVGLTAPTVEKVETPVVTEAQEMAKVLEPGAAEENIEEVKIEEIIKPVVEDVIPIVPVTPKPSTEIKSSTSTKTVEPAPVTVPVATSTNYYTNVDNQVIESPSSNTDGATGVCNDGEYTHAKHHQGACSGHGGVDYWY